ncbi:unnamed protein product [Pylaiella littoralis]
MSLPRRIYGRRTTFRSLTASWACGIVCGVEPLYEAEGLREVDEALKSMFREEARRPAVLYYDPACGYDRNLRARNNIFWRGTHLVVDRYPRQGATGPWQPLVVS